MPINSFRLARTRQVKADFNHGRHTFKDMVLIPPVDVVGGRGRVARETLFRIILPHHYQSIRIFVR